MPLCRPELVERFRQDVDATSILVLRQVDLPAQFFAVTHAPHADLLFKRLEDRSGVVVLIEAGVRYTGPDAGMRSIFAEPTRNGWRPLLMISPPDAQLVLHHTDSLLGLDGRPPRVSQSGPAIQPRTAQANTRDLVPDSDRQHSSEVDSFGVDLVEAARGGRLSAALFRENETAALMRILSKAGKNAACLVGPPGVGKTAVVEGLAIDIAQGRVPQSIAEARILDVNLSFLAAGAKYQNEFEGRMKALLDVARRDRNVILFLDEIHTLRSPASDASQMVKSDLGRGRIRCIGATTNSEFRLMETDEALARRFQVVPVTELTPIQTVEILRASRRRLEQHHRLVVPDDLLELIVELALRYVPDRHLPDKALDLLDEACASAGMVGGGRVEGQGVQGESQTVRSQESRT